MLLRSIPIIALFWLVGCGSSQYLESAGPQPASIPVVPERVEPVANRQPEAINKEEFWTALPPGMIEGRSDYPGTDVTEWTFANGTRVIFHPSQSEPRRVQLLAFRSVGFAGESPDDVLSAALSARWAESGMGPGGIRVETVVTEGLALIVGDGSTESLGGLLARAKAQMTNPESEIGHPELDPRDALSLLLAGYDEPVLARAFNPAVASTFYESRFGDPRQFTYVIVGDALPSEVEMQAALALSSARPSMGALLASAGEGRETPTLDGSVEWTMPRPGHQASFHLGFRCSIEASYDNLAGLNVLAQLLTGEIEAETGNEINATVSVDFDSDIAEVRLEATGPETDQASYRTRVLDVIRRVAAREPGVGMLVSAREAAVREHELDLMTNAGWLRWLVHLFRYDQDTREMLRFARRIRGTSGAQVHELAQTVLDSARYALIVQHGN